MLARIKALVDSVVATVKKCHMTLKTYFFKTIMTGKPEAGSDAALVTADGFATGAMVAGLTMFFGIHYISAKIALVLAPFVIAITWPFFIAGLIMFGVAAVVGLGLVLLDQEEKLSIVDDDAPSTVGFNATA